MRCGTCNYSEVKKTTTTIDEWVGGQLVAIRDVPVEKCPQCGEEYYSPDVLKTLSSFRLIPPPVSKQFPHPFQINSTG